jgi:hypothetical protein
MGRPTAEKPKTETLHFRVHPEVREGVEMFAAKEKRTLASMADLLLREAIIARRKRDKKSAAEIENLP